MYDYIRFQNAKIHIIFIMRVFCQAIFYHLWINLMPLRVTIPL